MHILKWQVVSIYHNKKKPGLSLCSGLFLFLFVQEDVYMHNTIEIVKNMKITGPKKSIFKFPLYLLEFNV